MNGKTRGDFAADRRLLLLSGIAVGIGAVCAFIAVILLSMIDFLTNLFYFHQLSFVHRPPSQSPLGLLAVAVPVMGGLIVGLMARYGSERIRGHGIPEALEAILFGKSVMSAKVAVLKPLSSAIAIGSGGPFGAEGPIIMTGGAFGSLIAQIFSLSAVERRTLLVSGAAAGMSATFSTPFAALLLAVELLLFEWKPRSLVPVAIASSVAAAVRAHLLGSGPLFPIAAHAVIDTPDLLAAAVIGIIAGTFSAALSHSLYKVEDTFARLPIHWMWYPTIGGLIVGIGGYFEPRALGIGYEIIGDILQGHLAYSAILGLLFVKCVIWVASLASGTSGGVLAPLLMMGCGLGALEAHFLPSQSELLWPLVSMGAVLGGMMRSPFTSVIFALELTHDINALPPLLIAAVFAHGFTVLVMKRSILTEKVARRGFDIYREYEIDPLEVSRVADVMTKEVRTIPATAAAPEILSRYFSGRKGTHRGYPVVDEAGRFLGMLTISNFLDGDSASPPASATARDLIGSHPIMAFSGETCREAAQAMALAKVGVLPVVDSADPKKLVGIITVTDLLKLRLRQYEDERKYERYLGGRRTEKTKNREQR